MRLRRTPSILAAAALVTAMMAVPAAGAGGAYWGVSGGDGANSKQGSAVSPRNPGIRWSVDLGQYRKLASWEDAAQPFVLTADGRLLVRAWKPQVDVPNQADIVEMAALHPDSGQVVWATEHLGENCAPAVAADGTIWSIMELNDDTRMDGVDVPEAGYAVVAVDSATGELIPGKRFSGVDATNRVSNHCNGSIQVAADGTVLFRATDGSRSMLRGLDPDDATQLWERDLDGGGMVDMAARWAMAPPGTPGAGHLYILHQDRDDADAPKLLKIDLATGLDVGEFQLGAHRADLTNEVLVDADGGVVVSFTDEDGNHLYRVADTGGSELEVDWHVVTSDIHDGGAFRYRAASLGLAGDVIVGYYASGDEWFGIDRTTGALRFNYTPTSFNTNSGSMAIDADGNVLTGTFGGGRLESFTSDGRLRWATREKAMGPDVHSPQAIGTLAADGTFYVYSPGDGEEFIRITAIDNSGGLLGPADFPDRISGADRFETAVGISEAFFEPGVGVAYVATGLNFPDALAGGVPAALDRAPVLLVTRDAIPTPTAAELSRLQPGRIVVFGGAAAVSDAVRAELDAFTSGTVTRVAGPDRFSTAAEISKSTFSPTPGRDLPVFVATGLDFPDALAGVPPAAVHEGPILLVARDALPEPTRDELARLNPSVIYVLGGPGAVSDAVVNQLRNHAGEVIRVAGDSRFTTAVAAGGLVTGQDPPDPLTVFVATGLNFPDALAGGAVAGAMPGPILLVAPDFAPQEVLDEIGRLRPDRMVIFGGNGAVSERVEGQLRARMDG